MLAATGIGILQMSLFAPHQAKALMLTGRQAHALKALKTYVSPHLYNWKQCTFACLFP